MTPELSFATRLLAWFDAHGRHDLPWQHPRTPYRVWLSEIMLQQTQVSVVAPYFTRFVAAFDSVAALAQAPLDDVLAHWSGLGYYARARNLHMAARRCVDLHHGELPRDLDALMALPGIGRSTAAAILAQAWGDRFAILDGNVKRVLCRYRGVEGWPGTPAVEKKLWVIAESLLPAERLADYTQAQMDFGATLCTRHAPSCMHCPLKSDCIALASDRVLSLPQPKPAKAIPQRATTVLLLRDELQRVLMQRRPPTGIWASLWSLPEFASIEEARDWLARNINGDFDNGLELSPIAHAFTHFRLRIHPFKWNDIVGKRVVRDNDDLRWIADDALRTVGIPAPIRTLIAASHSPNPTGLLP